MIQSPGTAEGRFAAGTFWKDAAAHGVTFYTAVPTIHQILVQRAERFGDVRDQVLERGGVLRVELRRQVRCVGVARVIDGGEEVFPGAHELEDEAIGLVEFLA